MKKEKIFVNKITKNINNNQKCCDVIEGVINKKNHLTIEDKLNKLFNTNGYVFNTSVKIITEDHTYQTKIVSKVNNYIITIDNDIINISSIKDIIF